MAAAAATTTATTTAARGTTRRSATASGGENGKLNGRFLAGTLGAGDFLLLVDDDFFEAFVAGVADVFVDRHGDEHLSRDCRGYGPGRQINIVPQESGISYQRSDIRNLALCVPEETRGYTNGLA
jgi:hypothetical protein